ncbi:hypothetical protein [Deinococcus radiophilus]|uniref:Uncharacterized protein n=2 Tax=Deinococcus radiophilus TaxID=32062 RepID=A0A431VQR4_9DEIO|nr:hypothetical protein [Deinococcus radiophilus]RTR25550.1 hypothetical protein EJ104_10475 [Deinococcus radiophilus]UFA50504.1 hypothetical protein LMT64_00865 [Deinococcus radiophilus]
MKRRFPTKDSPEFQEIMNAAETLRRELTGVGQELKREWDKEQPKRQRKQAKRERRAVRPQEWADVEDVPVTVIHETPVQPMTVQGDPAAHPSQAVQMSPSTVPALSTVGHPVGQTRQGLEVYALHELDAFEQAMQSLAVDLRAADVQLIWMPDQADRKGRQGLKVYPVARLGDRTYTLSQSSKVPTVVEVQGQHLHLLWEGEAVPVGPAEWAQLDRWRDFGGEPLRWLAQLRDNDWSWVLWVVVMIAAFNIWWVLGLAWIFGSGYLFGSDGVKPYRQGYFEDRTPPDSTKELLWHRSRRSAGTASLLPGMQDVPDHLRQTPIPDAPPAAPETVIRPNPVRPALDGLPDDLAAGLRMVRERVADLPRGEVMTAERYRLENLASNCEEAAGLYLRLPPGSDAAQTAAEEVRAMLQESLEALSHAGSHSEQQQKDTLQAIRDLRQSSVPQRDPLKLD